MKLDQSGGDLVLTVDSEEETERVGRALAGLVRPGTVVGLIGPLGSGKTRLCRALAEGLGVDPEAIASPTFVLIHEYAGELPIYHFDVYRLPGPAEFEALGPWDYFEGDGVCLVEWADRVLDVLPADAWLIRIEPTGPSGRRVSVQLPAGSGLADRLRALLRSV